MVFCCCHLAEFACYATRDVPGKRGLLLDVRGVVAEIGAVSPAGIIRGDGGESQAAHLPRNVMSGGRSI